MAGFAALSSATPLCPDVATSLASLGVGAAGSGINGACAIGPTIFSNISLAGSSSSGIAGAIDPTQIDIAFNQVGNILNVTLTNPGGSWALTGTQQFDLVLSYTATAAGPMFSGFGDSFTGTSTTNTNGTGAIAFDKSATNGSSPTQDLPTLSLTGLKSNNPMLFTGTPAPPLTTVNIVDNIQVHATNASATLNSTVNSFIVPEPMTSMLLGSGLLVLGIALRRKRR
jgi:hypothetical protein